MNEPAIWRVRFEQYELPTLAKWVQKGSLFSDTDRIAATVLDDRLADLGWFELVALVEEYGKDSDAGLAVDREMTRRVDATRRPLPLASSPPGAHR